MRYLKDWRQRLALLIVLQIFVLLLFTTQKKGYFIDEIYSWGLSNSYYEPFVVSKDVFGRWVDGRELMEYMTVQPGQGFSYGSVWYNQAQDVHPPLFYALLHTVCSFTPDTYGTWQGMILNLIFYGGCLAMIFLTADLLMKNRRAAAAAMMLWGLSAGGISTGIYIRMYMLSTFLTSVSIYLHVRMIRDGQKARFLAGICLATFLGLLTQYYFVFLAFFLSGFYVLWKLAQKKWKEAAIYSVCLFGAVGAMIGVFPACIHQLTRQDEFVAEKTRSNLAAGGMLATNLISYISSINMDFLGGRIRETAVLTVAAAVYCVWARLKKGYGDKTRKTKRKAAALAPEDKAAVILTLAFCFSFLAVSWAEVVPGARYIYNLYPLMTILAVWWGIRLTGWCMGTGKAAQRLYIGAAVFLTVLYGMGYLQGHVQYLYPENEERTDLAARYGDLDCVYIDNYENAPLTQDLIELSGFHGVYVMPEEQIDRVGEIREGRDWEKGIIVYVDTNEFWSSGYDGEAVIKRLQEKGGFKRNRRLYSHELSETYLLE